MRQGERGPAARWYRKDMAFGAGLGGRRTRAWGDSGLRDAGADGLHQGGKEADLG